MTGFEYVQFIEGAPSCKEQIPIDSIPYVSYAVGEIMKIMGFFPGMGLGRRNQGITRAIQHTHNSLPFGLGFKPTTADRQKMLAKEKERDQARAKKQGYTITIEPYRLTLNGSFVKEGEDFPYCGFPEPYYDITTVGEV
ncbi:G patch domain-containing protein, partial [Modestobacter lapidis]|nr:G patch domain-containing protein [Modestobacter lapidis]